MTSMTCSRCQIQCVFKARPKEDETFGSVCDSCSVCLCRNCAEINTTEAHAISLSQRSLLFYCGDCKTKLRELSRLFDKAKKELRRKDETISRLECKYKEKAKELEEQVNKLSVDNADQDYVKKIQTQKEEIIKINSEIQKLQDKNTTLLSEIEDLNNQTRSLTNELSELNILKNNMLVSIETLSKDNEAYVSEIKRANHELFIMKDGMSTAETRPFKLRIPTYEISNRHTLTSAPYTDCLDKPVTNSEVKRKPQILIFGNKPYVTGTALLFKKYLYRKFDINCQYGTGLLLEELTTEYLQLSKNFSKDDYVVIFVGRENALAGKNVDKQCLKQIAQVACNTNVIILGSSYEYNRPILNDYIYDINLSIKKYMHTVSRRPMIRNSNINGYFDKVKLIADLCSDILSQTELNDVSNAGNDSSDAHNPTASEVDGSESVNTDHFLKVATDQNRAT